MLEALASVRRCSRSFPNENSFCKGASGYIKRVDLAVPENWIELLEALFDGCAFGVATRSGVLMKKPWRCCSNAPYLLDLLSKYVCSGDHEHAACRGPDCKLSENYIQSTRNQ